MIISALRFSVVIFGNTVTFTVPLPSSPSAGSIRYHSAWTGSAGTTLHAFVAENRSSQVYKAFKVGANLNYRNLNRDLVKANTVTVGPELAYYALKGRKFSLLGIAAGTIGYQKAKAKSDLVYLAKSKAFVYGYEVGIRPEMLLSPKVALFAEYRFEMLFNSILRNNNHVGLGCVIYL